MECFEPLVDDMHKDIVLYLVSAVIGISILFFSGKIRNIHAGFRQLLFLLGGFVAVLSIGFAGFSFWKKQKLIPVCVDDTHFTSPYGKVSLDSIRQVYLMVDQQGDRMVQIHEAPRYLMLVVEETGTKKHVLSEET
jgi:hypothetical protein